MKTGSGMRNEDSESSTTGGYTGKTAEEKTSFMSSALYIIPSLDF